MQTQNIANKISGEPNTAKALLLKPSALPPVPKWVAISLGSLSHNKTPAFGKIIDKTGAGDAFWGAFISSFIEGGIPLAKLSVEDVIKYADRANIVAALSISKRGGIPSMPFLEEINRVLNKRESEDNYEAQRI